MMVELVHDLINTHYDPSYLRSIGRNFPQLSQTIPTQLAGIKEADFILLARQLLEH